MSNPYTSLSNEKLQEELKTWEQHVETACGWPSAYFAAKQVQEIVSEGTARGLVLVNNYPIKRG